MRHTLIDQDGADSLYDRQRHIGVIDNPVIGAYCGNGVGQPLCPVTGTKTITFKGQALDYHLVGVFAHVGNECALISGLFQADCPGS